MVPIGTYQMVRTYHGAPSTMVLEYHGTYQNGTTQCVYVPWYVRTRVQCTYTSTMVLVPWYATKCSEYHGTYQNGTTQWYVYVQCTYTSTMVLASTMVHYQMLRVPWYVPKWYYPVVRLRTVYIHVYHGTSTMVHYQMVW